MQLPVERGRAYGIVVDGFNGEYGSYTLAITSSQVLPASSWAACMHSCALRQNASARRAARLDCCLSGGGIRGTLT